MDTGSVSQISFSPSHPDLAGRPVSVSSAARPILFVVVDTEEEFDWGAAYARENTSVRAIRRLPDLQRLLDGFGLEPTYVIDYPVATQPDSVPVIRELLQSGRCAIGAHLHPWVTPPYVEELSRMNSFATNLPEDVETAKLAAVTDAIEEHIGVRPRIYKAGRYAFGPSTVRALERLEYDIDVSVNPCMNFSAERGPDFERFDARPFFFGRSRRLLEIPCTHGFAGALRAAGAWLHHLSESPAGRSLRLTGIFARLGINNKIMLSPETSTLPEMQALTRSLLRDGVRTFTLTLHSPSVEPGHTPYVRTAQDLTAFMNKIQSYCEFFLGPLGGVPGTLDGFRRTTLAGGATA